MSDTLTDGLIAHWRFQNGSLEDSSGNGRHLTQVGTVNFVADKDGIANNAVSFAGTSNSLECAYSDSPENPYISAWVKCVSPNASYEFLVSIRGINGYWQGFGLILKEGKIGWSSYLGGETHPGLFNIADGNFHHCFLRYDKASGRLSLYVDKVLRATILKGIGAPLTYANVNKIQLGLASNYPYESNDIIDEVRIGDRVLTGSASAIGEVATGEIAKLYDMGVNYTVDSTPPSFNSASIGTITYNSANLNVNSNETGKVYYKLLARGATAPTSAEIKANPTGQVDVTTNITSVIPISSLIPNYQYDCYIVAEDMAGNLQASPALIQFKTLPAPIIPVAPIRYIQPPKIIQYRSNGNIEIHINSSSDVYYTTNGTIPTNTSSKYTTPITISKNTTFLIIAYSPLSLSYSRIVEYFAEVPKNYRKNLYDTTIYNKKEA